MYLNKPKLHKKQKDHRTGDLRTMGIAVTSYCNFHCDKCYFEPFRNLKLVELSVLKRAVKELNSLGVFHYILDGGEPLTNMERLEEIIKMVYPDDSFINVVTNGWFIDIPKVKLLKSLGVDKITFSLDSGIEQEHDTARKKGSYARIMKGIDIVLQEKLLVAISIVATHRSLYSRGFQKAYEFAKDKKIKMDVQCAAPIGRWDGKREVMLTTKDSAYIKHLQLTSPILPNGQTMVNRDIYFGEYDHCPAGVEAMAIMPDGSLVPCSVLPYSLGNIKDKSITQMWKDLSTSKWFDGKRRPALCGEIPEFIDDFVMPYIGKPKPLDAYEVFDLKKKNGKKCPHS